MDQIYGLECASDGETLIWAALERVFDRYLLESGTRKSTVISCSFSLGSVEVRCEPDVCWLVASGDGEAERELQATLSGPNLVSRRGRSR